jgi:methyltransferase
MISEALFLSLLAAVAVQRLWELERSRRNEQVLRSLGAEEHARRQVPAMVALHVLWFAAMPLEVLLLERTFSALVAVPALAVFLLGQVLRITAMRALDFRWSVKVLTIPGSRAVTTGPFRFIRHPNYLGVWLETLALPLVHGAWLTALAFGLAQMAFLGTRIRAEERALRTSSDYGPRLDPRPRFVPRPRRSHGPL